jgi:hypothetical protein
MTSTQCAYPRELPKRLYPLWGSAQQAWEQADDKYVGDGNIGRPVGLTGLEEAWVEGKRQFPGRFHDLSRVKVLSEILARCVTEGRMSAFATLALALIIYAGVALWAKSSILAPKVVGVQYLRSVDASIFPTPIATHPQVCVYAPAEKAAEMIAECS